MEAPLAFFAMFVVQLFFTVDPLGLTPVFVDLTEGKKPQERKRIIWKAVLVTFFLLAIFAAFSSFIMEYFGISIESIQIGGGILLFFIGLEMIYAKHVENKIGEDKDSVSEKEDISITPLAIPLLVGPGAITSIIMFSGRAGSFTNQALIFLGIIIVLISVFLILSKASYILEKLGPIGSKVMGRFMGLIILFISVQYIINGVKGVLG